MPAPNVPFAQRTVARDYSLPLALADPARILECAQLARQRDFQRLLRRFLSQILYGCTSVHCTTPTCLSCSKRLVSRPFRPPTQLTARALAFYLASQHDPHRRLCPHRLKVDPDTFELHGAHGVCLQVDDQDRDPTCLVYPPAPSRTTTMAPSAARSYSQDADSPFSVADALERRHQARKDPKSLGQNLYDTLTIIFAYSKHVPHPLSILPLLASPRARESNSANFSLPPSSTPIGADAASLRETPSPPSEPQAFHTPEGPRQKSRKLCVVNKAPEILHDGHRVHKIQHVPNGSGSHLQPHKPSDLPIHESTDGVRDVALAVKFKLAGNRPISNGQMRAPTAPSKLSTGKNRNIDTQATCVGKPSGLPVVSHLTCEIMDGLKGEVDYHPRGQPQGFNFVVDYDANRRFQPAKPFVNRSLYYTLSDPDALLGSFRDHLRDDYMYSPLPHLDAYYLSHAFRDWTQRNGALVFDSLYDALEAVFRPPPNLDIQKNLRLKASRKSAAPSRPATSDEAPGRYLSDVEAAHIIMLCIHALTSSVSIGWPHTWVQVRKLRGWGVIIPGAPLKTTRTDDFMHPWLEIVDQLEHEPALRLATRLLKAIGTRRCHEHMLATVHVGDQSQGPIGSSTSVDGLLPILLGHLTQVEKAALHRRGKTRSAHHIHEDPGWTVTATFMEFLRTVVVKQWDGNVEINKWDSVGTAITMMSHFYANMEPLNLRASMFLIPHFVEEIDCIQAPLDFLKSRERMNSFHILQHHMFFPQDALVGYFRAVNFNRMFKQFQKSARITNFQSRWDQVISDPRHWNVAIDHLDVSLAEYLVLDVTRRNPLGETLDQLWGQQKRKLMKPLKVRMGIREGEVGLDQGGVTYEFFRLILSEAFKPGTGMFTVDEQNGMTWFQPASLEPLWKFEMVGVLISLAVYNGITLPVTFPIALYDHVLSGEHNSEDLAAIDFIADGWPTLAKSFEEFLAYPGEVAETFVRDYTFSFSAFGQNIDVDMQAFRHHAWPEFDSSSGGLSPSCDTLFPGLHDASWQRPRNVQIDPAVVTNESREQYVHDYVEWLTYRSVERQLEAFTEGFRTCLHRKSLSFFTPSTLRSLVEGSPSISVSLLRTQSVRYEPPYHAAHPTILDFWDVVEEYDGEEKKRLLEFVTANERIPITGYDSVKFEIIRIGGDTESLPTSSTCFGKLWLPEYKDRDKMRRKLRIALQNSKGFGII